MTARPRLILHIGMPKTGTTSIQSALAGLPDLPFHYPDGGRWKNGFNHNRLGVRLLEGQPDVLDEVLRETEGDILLSAEKLAWLTDLSQLDERTKSYDRSVIVYLREPVEFARSWYKQRVKTGQCTWTYRRFVDENAARFDYPALLRRWEAIGPLTVSVYSRDVLQRFFGQFGLTAPQTPEVRNVSPKGIGLVRFANMLPGPHKWRLGMKLLRLGLPVNYRRGDARVAEIVRGWDMTPLEHYLSPDQIAYLLSRTRTGSTVR